LRVHRHFLSKRDARKIIEIIEDEYPLLFQEYVMRNRDVEMAKINVDDNEYIIYIVKGKPLIIELNSKLIPLMIVLLELYNKYGFSKLASSFKYVLTDQGAMKPILRGADVMAPGIIDNNEFLRGDIVIVFANTGSSNVPIAVGEALKDSKELGYSRKGKIIKNLHRIGDKIWNISIRIAR